MAAHAAHASPPPPPPHRATTPSPSALGRMYRASSPSSRPSECPAHGRARGRATRERRAARRAARRARRARRCAGAILMRRPLVSSHLHRVSTLFGGMSQLVALGTEQKYQDLLRHTMTQGMALCAPRAPQPARDTARAVARPRRARAHRTRRDTRTRPPRGWAACSARRKDCRKSAHDALIRHAIRRCYTAHRLERASDRARSILFYSFICL